MGNSASTLNFKRNLRKKYRKLDGAWLRVVILHGASKHEIKIKVMAIPFFQLIEQLFLP